MRTHITSLVLGFSVLSLTAACGRAPDTLVCVDVSTSALAADEQSPFGFTPGEILDFVEGEHAAPMIWATGDGTDITVTITSTDDARYVERQAQDDGSGAESNAWCESTVDVDVLVEVSTADGSFAESWLAPLEVDSAGRAWMSKHLATGAIGGTFDFAAFDSTSYDTVEIVIELELTAEGSSGEIWADTYRETPEASTWSKIDIATF